MADHHITDRAATGFSVYRRVLDPGETFHAIFKMPRVPLTQPDHIAAVAAADYQDVLDKTGQYWEKLFGDFAFDIPEKRGRELGIEPVGQPNLISVFSASDFFSSIGPRFAKPLTNPP